MFSKRTITSCKSGTMLLFTAVLLFSLCSCAANPGDSSSESNQSANSASQSADASDTSLNASSVSSSSGAISYSTMTVAANGNLFTVELEDNSSTQALVELLKQGPITYTASDYGGFEKVGSLGSSLPTNDRQIGTTPGDVILYQGNKVCIYYGNNSWSFTKLGHISNSDNIKERLGEGDVEITLSLIE